MAQVGGQVAGEVAVHSPPGLATRTAVPQCQLIADRLPGPRVQRIWVLKERSQRAGFLSGVLGQKSVAQSLLKQLILGYEVPMFPHPH